MFNAYDRAMYHAIVNRRSFLDPANWKGNPFSGVSPSFIQRSVSAGLYFPLEDLFRNNVSSSYAVDGVLVGVTGALFTTPFNSVKYAMWSAAATSMTDVIRELYSQGGIGRLMVGAVPTLYRDMSFGLVYSVLRHQGDNGFINNVLAGCLATAVSSPFNYARMRIYGQAMNGGNKSPPSSTISILTELKSEIQSKHPSSILEQAKLTFKTLNIGWGALRIGIGMGVGSQIYKACCKYSGGEL